MASRIDRSPVSEWWWTIDRYLLFTLLFLLASGVVLSFAASPAVAERIGAGTYHFVKNQAFYAVPAALTLVAVSLLSPPQVRKAALILFAVMLLWTVATLFFGTEIKGSRRWLVIQPTEFLKPGFVVMVAYVLSEGIRRPGFPGRTFAIALLIITLAPVVAQPDLGQATLLTITWSALFFLAGLQWIFVAGLAAAGGLGMVGAYFVFPHFAGRINRFLDPTSGDTFQVDTAMDSFAAGGWFGVGPGEGTMKRILPDAHTDFVFAVTAEEFGIIACIGLVSLFGFIILRGLNHAREEPDPFVRFATAGLVILFGVQACINMAVNLHLMPAKGMTLPFISYGGSSLVAIALEMGFVLALTRRRPRVDSVLRPLSLIRQERPA